MMDGSLSMGDLAFPTTDYPGDKFQLVSMNAAGGVWSGAGSQCDARAVRTAAVDVNRADLNGDGVVDMIDVSILMSMMGRKADAGTKTQTSDSGALVVRRDVQVTIPGTSDR